MALEIEFEDDDHPDTVWLAGEVGIGAAGTGGAGVRESGTVSSRLPVAVPARPFRAAPGLLLQLGVLATAFVVGASAAAGFVFGRSAAQNRTIVSLHLAGGGAYSVAPTSGSADGAWSDTFDRQVSLSVANDGPDPLILVAGTLTGPYTHAAFTQPGRGLKIASGASATVRAHARIDCRSLFGVTVLPSSGGLSPLDTVADVALLTADGRTHHSRLVVDAGSGKIITEVCSRIPPPVSIDQPVFSSLIRPASYTVAYKVTNLAPFPVRVSTLQTSVNQWTGVGGLAASLLSNPPIPARGQAVVVMNVSVTDCRSALQAADANGYFPLVFTQAAGRSGAEQFMRQAQLVAHDVIVQACHGR